MARRYRLAMDFFDAQHQAPSPQWAQMAEAAARTKPNDDEAELPLNNRIFCSHSINLRRC